MVVVVVVLVSLYPWSGRPRVSSVENVHILWVALKFRLSIGGHAALARAGIPISFYYVIQKDINHNEGINQWLSERFIEKVLLYFERGILYISCLCLYVYLLRPLRHLFL